MNRRQVATRSQALASSRHINLNDLLASSFFKRRRRADFFLPVPEIAVSPAQRLLMLAFSCLFFTPSRPVFVLVPFPFYSPPLPPPFFRMTLRDTFEFWCTTLWLFVDGPKIHGDCRASSASGRNRVVPFVSRDLRRSFWTDLRRSKIYRPVGFFPKGLLLDSVQFRERKLQFQIILASGK